MYSCICFLSLKEKLLYGPMAVLVEHALTFLPGFNLVPRAFFRFYQRSGNERPSKVLIWVFFIGGCFPIVIRKKKIRCQRKGHSCSCTDYQTSSQESIDSIDSLSVVEPTTWQMPSKGRKRTRTISGASNFSGTSTMSTLSEKDRMWLQAFRFAGR